MAMGPRGGRGGRRFVADRDRQVNRQTKGQVKFRG